MYSGYAWLTNAVAPADLTRRLFVLAGMSGFLVIALATPHAFGADALLWGVGYMVVVLVHGGMYIQVNRRFWGVLPINVLAAALVIGAGLADGAAVYVLWTAAALVPIVAAYIIPRPGRFRLRAAHIVERHGLIVLVALGESVVAIGIGLSGQVLTPALAVAAVLGLALSAALWWAYFGGDDVRAEVALTRADEDRRSKIVLRGYYYAHIPLLIGIVAMAAGLKKALGHPWDPLSTAAAAALAGGVALFLVGEIAFRRALGMGPYTARVAATVLALATIPLGRGVAAALEMVALVGVLLAMSAVESRGRAPTAPLVTGPGPGR
jgi:low temperature requirement protein LtrA